ncbi:MAG: pyruvate, phosphate dikinase [Candidatus Coatesbacteria bacterium]|nr:pyruvate, phosphate dikinase [Candidatus Coatesbacteria bacterium]
MAKYVYTFGGGIAEGNTKLRNLLGGKGADLAEMAGLGIPVPAGFTITTEMCTVYYENERKYPPELTEEVSKGIQYIEKIMGAKFGDKENPLLVSVRSGARVSMPGMMDTVLNLGLNKDTVIALIKKSGNERFGWDSYRRFVQMYGDVVLGLKPERKEDEDPFELVIEKKKHKKGVKLDTELSASDMQELVEEFKALIKEKKGIDFPEDPNEQLWGAINAVFGSWMNMRAIKYRELNGISSDWGTAVNVQAMVFGNMGDDCATGVAFTRNPATGENKFYGEFLINAQGEDVVAGIRTPQQITKEGSLEWAKNNSVIEDDRKKTYPSLEELMSEPYKELVDIYLKLEKHYKEMQDIEFTIQKNKLWMLQTRSGKRTAAAAVKIAVDMVNEGLIDKETALLRVQPNQLNQLLHPAFDKSKTIQVIAKGLPASPGAASGMVVFHADDAESWAKEGKKVILVRIETSPEDIGGMNVAQGILTQRGGMTSHAAVVARGMGKCCVAGCGALNIDYARKTIEIGSSKINEGDWISLDGSTGEVILGKVSTIAPELGGSFGILMSWADDTRRLRIRTNADTPKDSMVARNFGAEGIGLCRTEHMFFEGDRIWSVREMIMAENKEGREKALKKLLPMQKEDFLGIFKVMNGLPVTIRTLDPPLHEFLPHSELEVKEMAERIGTTIENVKIRSEKLREFNPMLGHRGCRLGITYPEITAMQARAIMEAACELSSKGITVKPEIMIPLTGTLTEFVNQKAIVVEVAEQVQKEYNIKVAYQVGTMIEIPRAALIADQIAREAEFFSFGTNDLTQMTFGYSRDDAGVFLPEYLEKKILPFDPFQMLDREGVGQLVDMGTKRGRSTRNNLKVGICGEHGGEPTSIEFCHIVGMDYVSCSPYRVPIARLAAAQAVIKEKK